MSLFGIGRGGRPPVPQAPTADNRKLEKAPNISSVIKSAYWGRTNAGINDKVEINILLNKQATNKNAVVEFFFHSSEADKHPFDNPINIPANGLHLKGHWQSKAPQMKDWTKGYFSFRVKLDGEMKSSDKLKLTDDPVARVVRRNNTDGFDG